MILVEIESLKAFQKELSVILATVYTWEECPPEDNEEGGFLEETPMLFSCEEAVEDYMDEVERGGGSCSVQWFVKHEY